MKRILVPGDLECLEKKKIFSCNECGCVFEASWQDYNYESQYNEDYYWSKCPTCGRRAYEKTQ